jgi:hypothetical protein
VSTTDLPYPEAAHPQASRLTERWSVAAAVFAAIFVILLSSSGDLLFRDPDIFWHIAVGRKILATGAVPWTDEFSYTFAGHPWIAKEWLSQIILAATYDAAGWKGLAALMAIAVALTYSLIFMLAAERIRPVPALIVALFAYALSTPHILARPHVLSFPLIVLWVAGLVRAAEARTMPSLLLLPVMTLWANLHGGFTLGLALAAPLALEAVLASDPRARAQTATRWIAFMVAAVLAALITPYGYHAAVVTYQLFGGNEALKHIIEWAPLNFARDRYPGGLLLAALFLSLLFGVKLPLVRCLIVVGLVYLALVHVRFVPMAAIIIPLVIVKPLSDQFAYLRNGTPDPAWARLLAALTRPVLLIALGCAAAVAMLSSAFLIAHQPWRLIAPTGAVDYIQSHGRKLNLYNDYLFGGYLIFRGIPTFVDGRSDQLFGGGFLNDLYRRVDGPRREFLELLDKHKVGLALVRPNSREVQHLDEAAGWRRVFSDEVAVVFERQH